MKRDITPGPSGAGSDKIVHYVYDRHDGSIIASYYILGNEQTVQSDPTVFVQEAAELARRTSEQLGVLTLSPHEVPTHPSGPRQLRVDLATRKLVVLPAGALRHVRA
jgi:hypothetical protein